MTALRYRGGSQAAEVATPHRRDPGRHRYGPGAGPVLHSAPYGPFVSHRCRRLLYRVRACTDMDVTAPRVVACWVPPVGAAGAPDGLVRSAGCGRRRAPQGPGSRRWTGTPGPGQTAGSTGSAGTVQGTNGAGWG